MNKKKIHLFNLHHTGSAGVLMSRVALMAIIFLIVFPYMGSAQVGIGTKDINASAILQVEASTNDKGILLPRLTIEQRDAINTNATAAGETVPAGLTIYCTDCFGTNSGSIYYYNGVEWRPIDNNALDTAPPSAPTSLTASNPTDSSIDLSWTASTDNVGVTGYYIYFSNNTLAATVTSGTSTTISGLSVGTSYTFYATAYDAAGNASSESNTASATTTQPPPVVINSANFESGWSGWRDGGDRCSRQTNGNCTGFNGSRSWGYIRIHHNRGNKSSMFLDNKDLSPYSYITVEFLYKTNNFYDPNDYFKFEYRDGNGNWIEVFRRTGQNLGCTTVTLTLLASDYNFGTVDDFKFRSYANRSDEQARIHDVLITGYY